MGIISLIKKESEAVRNLGTERLNKLDMIFITLSVDYN